MKILSEKRCIIGESPIWNEKERVLYFTNGYGKELCKYNFVTEQITSVKIEKDIAAIAFSKANECIVSRDDGVFILNADGGVSHIYDKKKYKILNANDMKAGPDGKIYVGTQSEKRLGISNKRDGRLYSVDKTGEVRVLLENLSLSNGMEWSLDEKYFYHTDSDTNYIKEYEFDIKNGTIAYSGRMVKVCGVDGFTIGLDNKLYAACWGKSHIAVIDPVCMRIENYIKIPCYAPASCCFCGINGDLLAVTSASYGYDISEDKNAGFTFLIKMNTEGRKPYLYG